MNPQTKLCIDILDSLFDSNLKEALAIQLPSSEGDQQPKKITLKDQFRGRWANSYPCFEPDEFIVRAAQIINWNKYLFDAVVRYNSPDFQEKFIKDLSDEETFALTRKTKRENNSDYGLLNLSQTKGKTLTSHSDKTRSGNAEYGIEYENLEKKWDKEDEKLLESRPLLPEYEVSISVDENPDIKGVRHFKPVISRTNNPTTVATTTEEDQEQIAEDLILQNVNLTKSGGKTSSDTLSNNFGFTKRDSYSKQDGKSLRYSGFNLKNMMFSARFRDPRETAFQTLDVLFIRCY